MSAHVHTGVLAVPVLQEIELSEALCGFHRIIKTLDNRELVITSHPGDVIKHGGCVHGYVCRWVLTGFVTLQLKWKVNVD